MKNRKKNKLSVLLLVLLGVTIGYAALSTTLKINGTTNIAKNTWSVYWDAVGNVQKTDNVTVTTGAAVDQTDNTLVNFTVTLNQPGDFYEFQVDAVNAGSLDAMVDIISTTITDQNDNVVTNLPPYIVYTMKYVDGTNIERYHLLEKANQTTTPSTPTRERIKVRIEFSRSITNQQLADMGENDSYTFDIRIPYKQADENAIDRKGIASCPGCVFAFYTDDNYPNVEGYEESAQPLENYTKDYTTLKWNYYIDEWDYLRLDPSECIGSCTSYENQQRNVFLGHILDKDDKIVRAFACHTNNGNPYCIEGVYYTGGTEIAAQTAYSNNRTLMQRVFNNTCTEGIMDNTDHTPYTRCSNGEADRFGNASTTDDLAVCYVNYIGGISCTYNNQ